MKMNLEKWINAYDLSCPKLKYNIEMGCWIALEEDPCHSGSCGKRECHNYQNGFDKQERLIIVVSKKTEAEQ